MKSIQTENVRIEGIEIQYTIGGLIVLIGSIVFLKAFDFLAAQSATRLLDAANCEIDDYST